MSDNKVIPFRRRESKPTEVELEIYRKVTRNWSAEMRQLMLPQYCNFDTPPDSSEPK